MDFLLYIKKYKKFVIIWQKSVDANSYTMIFYTLRRKKAFFLCAKTSCARKRLRFLGCQMGGTETCLHVLLTHNLTGKKFARQISYTATFTSPSKLVLRGVLRSKERPEQ